MGIGAAQDLAMKHTRDRQVPEEFCFARNLFNSIDAGDTMTHVFQLSP